MTLSGQYSEQKSIHISVNDGIPSSTCYDILQDINGFIWIATEGGLAKYDGQEFKLFTSREGPIDNEVINIKADNANRIWLNTLGVLSYVENDSIKTLPSSSNLTLNWNFHVVDAANDLLWISRISNLQLYDAKTLKKIDFDNTPFADNPIAKKWVIGAVGDKVLIYYEDGFIYEYTGSNITNKFYLGDDVKNLSEAKRMFKLDYPYLLYTDISGCRMMNLEDKSDISILQTEESLRQVEWKNNELWILTDIELKRLILDKQFKILEQQVFLTNQNCSKFLIDSDENLWAAVYKKGVYFFPKLNKNVKTTRFDQIGSNNLESILVSDNRIIAGSEKGELYIIENEKINKYTTGSKLKSVVDRVLDIIEISKNQYLVSCDSGIYLFRNGTFKYLVKTNAKNIFVADKRVIICCYNQTYEANLDKLIAVSKPVSPSKDNDLLRLVASGRSYSSLIDSKDNLWIADVGRGLIKISEKDTIYFKNRSPVFNATISRLVSFKNGMIAAATKGEGIILIDENNKIEQISTDNGLISDYCYDVSSDGDRLFVATNRGACILDPIDVSRREFKIRTYNRSNGLDSDEVLDVRFKNDKLYIAMNQGIAEIEIDEEKERNKEKNVFVKVFSVNGQNKPIRDSYSFKSHENDILIRYISPNFNKDQRTVYSYKLEGVDNDWINTTSIETHYSNLNAGTYIFKYGLNQNRDSTKYKTIRIDIKPSFFNTFWFKLIALALFSLFIILPIFVVVNRKRKIELENLVKIKTAEVEEKMKLIAQTNAQLVSSNKELEQFAYIASHDLQEPINTISSFGKILQQKYVNRDDKELSEILKIMGDSSSRMKELVKDLLIYSRIGREKNREEVDLNVLLNNIKFDLEDLINGSKSQIIVNQLPTVVGNSMELRSLFLNLIANAIKYQKPEANPKIIISAVELPNGHEFTVEDNGIGIEDENRYKIFEVFKRLHNKEEYKGTGIGLAQCKKIVELHKGEIWVESEKSKGSKFKFTIIV